MKKFTLVWEPEDFSADDYQRMIQFKTNGENVYDGMNLLVGKDDAEAALDMEISEEDDGDMWQRIIDFLGKHKLDYIGIVVDT